MIEVLVKQEDSTYIAVPLKVEVHGTGIVTPPAAPEEKPEGEN